MAKKKFAKYFTLQELTYSTTAEKLKLSNIPPTPIELSLQRLATDLLDPLREAIKLPIKINSGYRSAAVNKAVGGVSISAHCYGNAADMVCPAYGNAKAFGLFIQKWLKDNNIAFDQLIYEFDSWIHIGLYHYNGAQRKQVITINKKGTFPGIV